MFLLYILFGAFIIFEIMHVGTTQWLSFGIVKGTLWNIIFTIKENAGAERVKNHNLKSNTQFKVKCQLR